MKTEHTRPRHEGSSLEANLGDQEFSSPQIERLVWTFLLATGRIDKNGVVQPVEIERRGKPDEFLIGGPLLEPIILSDVFFPTKDMCRPHIVTDNKGIKSRNSIMIMDVLYSLLAGMHDIKLTDGEADYVNYYIQVLRNILELEIKPYTGFLSDEQLTDAFHITNKNSINRTDQDFETLRIYITGGIHGASIAYRMIDEDTDFSGAKIWVPQPVTSNQRFRNDTPIFEVKTFGQLQSVITHLRRMNEQGYLFNTQASDLLVGQAIPGIAGAYIGQIQPGTSFNGTMDGLFKDPLELACSEQTTIRAGDKFTDYNARIIAQRVIDLARLNARNIGIDENNHAFLADQPVERILQIINS